MMPPILQWEQGDDDLRNHRHEQAIASPWPSPAIAAHSRFYDLPVEWPYVYVRVVPVFAFVDQRGFVLVGCARRLSRQLWTMFITPPTHHSH